MLSIMWICVFIIEDYSSISHVVVCLQMIVPVGTHLKKHLYYHFDKLFMYISLNSCNFVIVHSKCVMFIQGLNSQSYGMCKYSMYKVMTYFKQKFHFENRQNYAWLCFSISIEAFVVWIFFTFGNNVHQK